MTELGSKTARGGVKVVPKDGELLRGQGCGCGRSFLKGGLGKGPGAGFWLELLVSCLLHIWKEGKTLFFKFVL